MTEQLFILVNTKVVVTPQPRPASCLRCKPAARLATRTAAQPFADLFHTFLVLFFFFLLQTTADVCFASVTPTAVGLTLQCLLYEPHLVLNVIHYHPATLQSQTALGRRRNCTPDGYFSSPSSWQFILGDMESFVLHKQPHILSLKRLF